MSHLRTFLSCARAFNFFNAPKQSLPTYLKYSSSQFCSKVTPVSEESGELKPGSTPASLSTDQTNTDLSDYGSIPLPTFNLAAYADKSPILQELVKLGVRVYKFDEKPDVGEFLLGLDFEKNIKPYLTFLHDNGLPADEFGNFITNNPLIFKESLDDLEVRINYLKSKKFDSTMISQIITKNAFWLSVPVKTIDERLGFLQQSFLLSGNQLRQLVTKAPRLATVKKKFLLHNIFTFKEEIGFDEFELKKVLLTVPSLLLKSSFDILATYDYLTTTMKVSRDLIVEQPMVLTCRKFILMERHQYLVSLGRAQYNPLLPGYVSLANLIGLRDEEFCEKVAKTSVQLYDEFLKTL